MHAGRLQSNSKNHSEQDIDVVCIAILLGTTPKKVKELVPVPTLHRNMSAWIDWQSTRYQVVVDCSQTFSLTGKPLHAYLHKIIGQGDILN